MGKAVVSASALTTEAPAPVDRPRDPGAGGQQALRRRPAAHRVTARLPRRPPSHRLSAGHAAERSGCSAVVRAAGSGWNRPVSPLQRGDVPPLPPNAPAPAFACGRRRVARRRGRHPRRAGPVAHSWLVITTGRRHFLILVSDLAGRGRPGDSESRHTRRSQCSQRKGRRSTRASSTLKNPLRDAKKLRPWHVGQWRGWPNKGGLTQIGRGAYHTMSCVDNSRFFHCQRPSRNRGCGWSGVQFTLVA
jgi:hypothetical protein